MVFSVHFTCLFLGGVGVSAEFGFMVFFLPAGYPSSSACGHDVAVGRVDDTAKVSVPHQFHACEFCYVQLPTGGLW